MITADYRLYDGTNVTVDIRIEMRADISLKASALEVALHKVFFDDSEIEICGHKLRVVRRDISEKFG